LVLVGGVALLLQVTGPDAPVADTVVPTTLTESAPTTLAESVPTTLPDPPSSFTWSRVPHDEAVFGGARGQRMSSVTVGGPGLVAVGSVGNDGDDGDANAAVWASVDGLTWSRVPYDEAVFGGSTMNSVAAGGPGLVAVGSDGRFAAVWTSVDGITWSRVPHDEAVVGGAEMNSVTVGGPGLVAVGWVENDREIDGDGAAAVWTSVDGVTWSRVPHDVTLFGGTGNQRMYEVTAAGAGLVAVGADGGFYATRPNAVVWTSVDGVTWLRVPHDEAVFGGTEMRSVTVAGVGLVAVGDTSSGGGPNRPIESGASVFVWVAEPDD
jgi:hypothetical protein